MPIRLRALHSKLRSRWDPGIPVLRYHRIADVEADPLAITVSPAHFAEHLEALRTAFEPMTLARVRDGLDNNVLPRRGIAITFDDGYADNLLAAAPLLDRYDVPATIFIISGYVGRDRDCWWDVLERVVLQPGRLPERLEIATSDYQFTFDLEQDALFRPADYERHRNWSWRAGRPPTARHRLFRTLFRELQRLEEQSREAVVTELVAWAGATDAGAPKHRMLTADEVTQLQRDHPIEVGAHSVSHPVLAALPAARQRQEIAASKASLEAILGAPVQDFAYPYGDPAESATLVADAGFRSAWTTDERLVRRGADRFHLPRLYVGNWPGDRFARYLRRWM